MSQQNNTEWVPSKWHDPSIKKAVWDISVSPHTIHLDENGNAVGADGGSIPEKRGEWFVLNLAELNLQGYTVHVQLANSQFQGVEIDTIPPMNEYPVLLNKFPNELFVRPRSTDGGEGQITMYVTDTVLHETKEKTIKFTAQASVSSSSDKSNQYYDPSIQPTASLVEYDWGIDISPSYGIYVNADGSPGDDHGFPQPSYVDGWYELTIDERNIHGNTVELMLLSSYYDSFDGIESETIPPLETPFMINKFPNTIKIKPRVLKDNGIDHIALITSPDSPNPYYLLNGFEVVHDEKKVVDSSSSEWTPSDSSDSYMEATQYYDPSIQPTGALPADWKIKFIPDTIYLNSYGQPIAAEGGPLPSCENSWYEVTIDSDDLYGNTVELRGSYSDHNMIAEMNPPFHEHFLFNKVPNTIKLRTIPKTPIEFPEEGGDMSVWDAQKYWEGPVRGGIHFIYSEPFDSSSSEGIPGWEDFDMSLLHLFCPNCTRFCSENSTYDVQNSIMTCGDCRYEHSMTIEEWEIWLNFWSNGHETPSLPEDVTPEDVDYFKYGQKIFESDLLNVRFRSTPENIGELEIDSLWFGSNGIANMKIVIPREEVTEESASSFPAPPDYDGTVTFFDNSKLMLEKNAVTTAISLGASVETGVYLPKKPNQGIENGALFATVKHGQFEGNAQYLISRGVLSHLEVIYKDKSIGTTVGLKYDATTKILVATIMVKPPFMNNWIFNYISAEGGRDGEKDEGIFEVLIGHKFEF